MTPEIENSRDANGSAPNPIPETEEEPLLSERINKLLHSATPLPAQNSLLKLTKEIPGLRWFLTTLFRTKTLDKTEELIVTPIAEAAEFIQPNDSFTAIDLHGLGEGLHGVSFAMELIQAAFLIPSLHYSAFIKDKELPFYLTPRGKLAYLSITIAIGATVLATTFLAAQIAPYIALSLASVILANNVLLLGKMIGDAIKDNNRLNELKSLIEKDKQDLETNLNNIIGLEERLKKGDISPEEKNEIRAELEKYKYTTDRLNGYCNERAIIQNNKKHRDPWRVGSKVGSTLSATLILTGIIVALFFPPAGAIIAAVGAGVGVATAAVMLAKFGIPKVTSAIKSWFTKTPPKQGNDQTHQSTLTSKVAQAEKPESIMPPEPEPIPAPEPIPVPVPVPAPAPVPIDKSVTEIDSPSSIMLQFLQAREQVKNRIASTTITEADNEEEEAEAEEEEKFPLAPVTKEDNK